MGYSDLKKIKAGIISVAEKSLTQIGMVLGIIGTFISPMIIVFGIALVVGINVFTAQSEEVTKDAIVSECTTLGAMAQQYYRKPLEQDGGDNSFEGWEIPSNYTKSANGSYSISSASKDRLVIEGSPLESTGYPWVVKTEVTPVNITSVLE
jgi:hypothetical protein